MTTLEDEDKKYILGRQDRPAQSFTYNYDENRYQKVLEYCDRGVHDFLVVFPDGSGYTMKGSANTFVKGYGTNSAIEAQLTVVVEELLFKKGTEVSALLPTA